MDVFTASTSISFGVLGIVFLCRKFDPYFGILCLITTMLGYCWPFFLVLPYFIVLWRVLLGRHIKTDTQLFIGRYRRHFIPSPSEESTAGTLAHWIVAVLPDGSDEYLMTHATGEVLSGLGERHPYEIYSREWMERYSLHHVGWVTRRQRERHMHQVQGIEPMASGYTCQEYAVDIAFQISSSRTYTFMKCITLPRVRTVLFFVAVAFSTLVLLVENFTKQPVTVFIPINPKLFNPMMLTNFFVSTEAFRLGYTNVRREESFWLGIRDRLNVYFRVINHKDIFKLFFVVLFSSVIQMWMNDIMLTLSILILAIIMAK